MTNLPEPGQVFGRYRLDAVLGRGAMGVVYLATDTQLKRQVALKVVAADQVGSENLVRRFELEAEAMAKVASPHIVQIFDYGTHEGRPFLVSQYVAGGDLASRVAREPLSPRQAVEVTAQVAEALAAAHRAGVLHRDVKPANVLVDDVETDGDDPSERKMHAYLCDFGIAQAENSRGLTQAGGITGSWSYLSPERLEGQPATPASDVYSVGCLLWACLTGRSLYQGTDAQIAMAHVNAPIPQLPGNDEETRHLNAVLTRALAKDPADRYASAREFRQALLTPASIGGAATTIRQGTTTAPPAASGPSEAPKSRKPAILGAAGLCLLLIVGGLVYLLTRDSHDDKHHPAKHAAVAGDGNGDGKADPTMVIYSQGYTQTVTFMSSSKGYKPVVHTVSPASVVTGDVSGDGKSDLVSVDANKGAATIVVTDDYTGSEKTTTLRDPAIGTGSAVELGDFNGDGHVDLALVQSTASGKGTEILVSLGGANGAWAKPTPWFDNSSWGTNSLFATGDFTGDGKTDLATFDNGKIQGAGTAITVLASDGSKFTPSTAAKRKFTLPATQRVYIESSLFASDVTGDDRPELMIVSAEPTKRQAQTMSWKGTTGFSAASSWYSGAPKQDSDLPLRPFGMEDVNGDGKADLVALRQVGPRKYELTWQQSTGAKLLPPQELATYTSTLTAQMYQHQSFVQIAQAY